MPEQRDRSHKPSGEELKRMRAEREKRQAAEKAARKEALQIVERWNDALAAGRGELWSPTIRAAVLAGMPWLDVYCPGCGTGRALDIRTLDRHRWRRWAASCWACGAPGVSDRRRCLS
jgi:hypothetical protein